MGYKKQYLDVTVSLRLHRSEVDGMLDADKFGDVMTEDEVKAMLREDPSLLLYSGDWEFEWVSK